MNEQIVLLFVLIDNFLKIYGHTEDPQRQMSDAEVLTTALVAMLYFGGRFERARRFMRDQRYILKMLSKSRFKRHLLPLRKKNSNKALPPWMRYRQSIHRKAVETTGSLLEQLLPRHIHAVTAAGFEFKVAFFVLALSFTFLFKAA